MNLRTLAWLSSLASLQVGCGLLGGVEVRSVGTSVQKPSNVALYVAVENDSEPVDDLEAKSFRIYEDDVPVDTEAGKHVLGNRDDVAVHHTVVLLDLSGGPDEATRARIARGASHLAEKLQRDQGVTLLGFDGSPRLHPLGELPRNATSFPPKLDSITSFRSSDESRNLNGALVQALDQLDARLMRHKKPLRVGTLVVFSRGDDLAGRVPADVLWERLKETPHEIYGIGLDGAESQALDSIAKNGVKKSASITDLPVAFEDMALTVRRAAGKYYLVQYCSPGRSGIRRLRLEVQREDKDGKVDKGALELELDAREFSGGCDPKTRPTFAQGLSEPGARKSEPEASTEPKAKAAPGKARSGALRDVPSTQPTTEEEIVAPPSSSDYE